MCDPGMLYAHAADDPKPGDHQVRCVRGITPWRYSPSLQSDGQNTPCHREGHPGNAEVKGHLVYDLVKHFSKDNDRREKKT